MKKPSKRFENEQQILDAIDRTRDEIAKKMRDAEALDREADKIREAMAVVSDSELYLQMKIQCLAARKRATALRDKCTPLERRLIRLGDKLSVMRTALLPVSGGVIDQSIPAR